MTGRKIFVNLNNDKLGENYSILIRIFVHICTQMNTAKKLCN